MARLSFVVLLLAGFGAGVAALFAHSSEAAPAAAIQRTFVSTSGNDANPCTRADPCRNFQAALVNTLAGGEVVALDSGGYGPVTIDKSVTIAGAPGAHVAITVFSGTGITIGAGVTDTVVLRNLYVTGLGGGTGISFEAGGTLLVQSVVATGFISSGLHATATDATLLVRDSAFPRNGNGFGIFVNGALQVEIADTSADRNSDGFVINSARGSIVGSSATRNAFHGFFFHGASTIAVSDSLADGNVGAGVLVADSGTQIMLSGVTLSNNGDEGLQLNSGTPVARIGGSTVTENGIGLSRLAGTLETFGDNLVRGNTTETSGTITAVGKT
jgi:hypothetical protein